MCDFNCYAPDSSIFLVPSVQFSICCKVGYARVIVKVVKHRRLAIAKDITVSAKTAVAVHPEYYTAVVK